ncbi:hypothetical protein [Jannaschia seohaensis]|uniref:hypothetical protein n=1 Tax=Jannaschia seohaensis TaxID=475081 RepID=UPI001B8768B0|nr:hypothetical protein [Jannaschia seohaensis]
MTEEKNGREHGQLILGLRGVPHPGLVDRGFVDSIHFRDLWHCVSSWPPTASTRRKGAATWPEATTAGDALPLDTPPPSPSDVVSAPDNGRPNWPGGD